MKKLLTAALTAAALVLPAAVSYAAPAAKAASASHSGDAARQTDSRQSSAMNQTHTAVSKYSFDDTVRRLETAVKEKGMTKPQRDKVVWTCSPRKSSFSARPKPARR